MEKRVKVLEFLPGLNYGGAQTMIISLCSNIDRNAVECDFIIDHEGLLDLKDTVEAFGAKVYTMPSFKGSNLSEVRNAWDRFFEQHDYDIIHCHVRSYSFIVMQIARKHGMKTIIHSHNTSNGKGIGSMIRAVTQLPLRKTADYYFGCSQEAGEWLFGKKITQGDRFYVIDNGIDTDRFTYDETIRTDYREKFGLIDEKTFIQVGRMYPQKNYPFTLNAFARYLSYDKQGKLFIVGDGEQEDAILKQIEGSKLSDNVVILQHRDDVDKLLQMADVFLMPSLYEGLSVACVEAQSSGIPCLCSDRCDRNVDITGNCRFLPLDEETWVNAMKEDYPLRRPYKKEIAAAGFDAGKNAKWLQDFYCSIV
ncbi:MAG: glycosyltransferase [Erysipelotrichaceae bacterium]|nr:glycosyltransferase [Erysipelotrichaceae bacterium]